MEIYHRAKILLDYPRKLVHISSHLDLENFFFRMLGDHIRWGALGLFLLQLELCGHLLIFTFIVERQATSRAYQTFELHWKLLFGNLSCVQLPE
jgi:hypothetical protein